MQKYYRATEMTVFLRASTSDQFNRGELLTHHLADDENADLDPVRAVRDLFAIFPERAEKEKELPLMRWEDGSPVTRDQIRRVLGEAGESFGLSWECTGTHSLRVAGASALYQASGGNTALVKRMGRWASDVFEGYIWESRELTLGLSSRMLSAPWAVHPSTWGP